MSTIQETVDQSLSAAGYGSYGQYARPVVTALVDREQQIVGRLIEFAQHSDLNVDEVRNALTQAGMMMPPAPEPTPAQGWNQTVDPASGEGDLAGTLARIEQALTGLTQFARQNGYNG